MINDNDLQLWPQPWPLETIKQKLLENQILYQIVRPRQRGVKHDRREYILENLVQDVLGQQFGKDHVFARKQLGTTLKLKGRPFPAYSYPDVAVEHQNRIHIAELKSNRTEYGRFDAVFESRPFKEYLNSQGDFGAVPWEVEQDLIKLHLFRGLSQRIGSCLFVMIDAYQGPERSWTDVFSDKRVFRETMRTGVVRGLADRLLKETRIEQLITQNAAARLIICAVHPFSQ